MARKNLHPAGDANAVYKRAIQRAEILNEDARGRTLQPAWCQETVGWLTGARMRSAAKSNRIACEEDRGMAASPMTAAL